MKIDSAFSISYIVVILAECSYSAYIFGYMLRSPISNDQMSSESSDLNRELATLELTQSDQPSQNGTGFHKRRCQKDEDCQKKGDENLYCDLHYGYCDIIRVEMELCRHDQQCAEGLVCMFGKCQKEPKSGHKGARCKANSDCKANMCCARQHGEKICKPKLQKGQRCYVPSGGLDYSLNELCPCDTGLVCTKKKRKNERKEQQGLRAAMDMLRCVRT